MKREPEEGDEIVTAFRDGEVTLRNNRRVDGFTNAVHEHGYQRILKGDLVIHAMDAFAGAIGVSDSVGKSTPVYSVCTPKHPNTNTHYYGRLLRHMALSGYINSLSKGIRERSTEFRWSEASNVSIAVPSYPEQTQIADFLDRETAKIDALVSEQRRLIELLKEKRQAVISHAVTRGLNPSAPLKPSGIDWLGDIPAHWKIKPLKYLVTLKSGGTPSKENLAYWDGEVPWASSKDLKFEELSDTQDHITQQALNDGSAELLPAGSILTVVRGMILLHTFPVTVTTVPMAINQDLKALTARSTLEPEFLAWLLRGASAEILNRTDEAAHGTKVLRLETWLSMQMPVPPIKEQQKITATIRKQMKEFDTLTAEAERAITLLQERRTALISAAVTGQIDVCLVYPRMKRIQTDKNTKKR